MRTTPFVAAIVVPVLLSLGYAPSQAEFTTRETARVRTHLAAVERALRARDVTGLTPAQQAARVRNLDVLHAYWTAGVFPSNTDFPGERMPYFIDRSGVRCAMAYLIEQSGGGEFVARVAATNNNARIREIQDDPDLVRWLGENGLTIAEAAWIQPEYQPPPPPASDGYKATTTVSVGVNATSLILNATRTGLSPRLTGALGILVGVSGMAAGVPNFDESGQRKTLGLVNAGIGAASLVLGAYRFSARAPMASNALVSPWLDDRGAPGLSLSVRF